VWQAGYVEEYAFVNLANWESRVPLHVVGYDLNQYIADPGRLSKVVTFDRPRLGDLAGKDVVHLQCHLGTDTLSLARLGARVTGLDFSPSALAVARKLAADCETPIRYVEAELYDAPAALGVNRFDVVYTGIGALCWLPDIERWAGVVASLLRPGGRLFIREGHPALWALGEAREDGLITLDYPYFEGPGVHASEATTYVDHEGELTSPETVDFNHGMAEIITAIMHAGMQLTSFEEHNSVPWAALGDLMEELPSGEFRLKDRPQRLAASYTLQAVKH
jgi:SAM-dependent methyltransferase